MMMPRLFCLIVLMVLVMKTTGAKIDFFSSSLKLDGLLETHDDLLPAIQEYTSAVEEAYTILSRYTSESEVEQVSEKWTAAGDPLQTYLLIRRTTHDLEAIVSAVRKLRALDPLLEIENLRRRELLPETTDFKGVARSLVRLQRMYLLQPKDLVNGNITNDMQSPVRLTAEDCLHIGDTADDITPNQTIPMDAFLWYDAGIRIAKNDSTQETIGQILKERRSTAKNRTKKFLAFPREFLDDRNTDIFNNTMDSSTNWHYVETIARRLCRGENLRAPSMDVENYCYLRQGPHPYLKLRPLKLEIKSLDPYVAVMHDAVGEGEIETLKEQANLKNEPSTHVLPNASSGTSDVRVSITSWLPDSHTPDLSKRISIYLGMKTNASLGDVEEYQVLNYGIGGHYSLHRDYFENLFSDKKLNLTGNRIATLMFYLNEVEKGGYTVFPYPGLAVKPEKGSAVFWWNLRSGGNGDFATTHGACPVVIGTKWVANKWFRERPQMFDVPCDEDPDTIVKSL